MRFRTKLLLTFLIGLGGALSAPAWQAIVPELVPRRELPTAIALNSASTEIINSYIADIKAVGADAQAIAGWNGPGPFVIANGGELMEPILVKKVATATGDVIREAVPRVRRRVIPKAAARMVAEMLIAVTEGEGTGVEAAIDGCEDVANSLESIVLKHA